MIMRKQVYLLSAILQRGEFVLKSHVFYLCPQVEGQQDYVCWGVNPNIGKDAVKNLVLQGLNQVAGLKNQWISGRSFSVLMAEDEQGLWVAVPRQVSVKIMSILNDQFHLAGYEVKHIITSYHHDFSLDCPFYPVISYDRGFIYDGSRLNEIHEDTQLLNVVNG